VQRSRGGTGSIEVQVQRRYRGGAECRGDAEQVQSAECRGVMKNMRRINMSTRNHSDTYVPVQEVFSWKPDCRVVMRRMARSEECHGYCAVTTMVVIMNHDDEDAEVLVDREKQEE
jgi:hypothetical protein